MLKKSLLTLALAFAFAAATTAQAQGPSTPAKKELVARILKVQQPAIEAMARGLVEQPAADLMNSASEALPQRVPKDKQEAVAREIQEDVQKYLDETVPLVRERALKLAPTTVGSVLEERFTEDELKQIVSILESPVYAKFQHMGEDMQKALVEKVIAETRASVEPKVRALEQTMAKRLGVSSPAAAPAPAPRAPARPASR
jgi:uncharacterized protein